MLQLVQSPSQSVQRLIETNCRGQASGGRTSSIGSSKRIEGGKVERKKDLKDDDQVVGEETTLTSESRVRLDSERSGRTDVDSQQADDDDTIQVRRVSVKRGGRGVLVASSAFSSSPRKFNSEVDGGAETDYDDDKEEADDAEEAP